MSVHEQVGRMTVREKCAQVIFVDYRFDRNDPDLVSHLVRKEGVGGLALGGGSVFDVPSFVNWAQKVARIPLIVAADPEDRGRIAGATVFPSWSSIARTRSADFAQTKARHGGLEARALGVRLILGVPADNPLAASAVEGYHYSKVAVCIRKFPDPGVGALAATADAILAGHEVVPELDEEQIASLSRTAVQGILRRELRFEGLVITDTLARLGTGAEILERAVNAGVDVLLGPADPARAIDVLEAAVRAGRVGESTLDRAATRILLHKERLGLFAERMVDVGQVEQVVGAPAHRAAADRIAHVAAQLGQRGAP